jgi:hypothetical protein
LSGECIDDAHGLLEDWVLVELLENENIGEIAW